MYSILGTAISIFIDFLSLLLCIDIDISKLSSFSRLWFKIQHAWITSFFYAYKVDTCGVCCVKNAVRMEALNHLCLHVWVFAQLTQKLMNLYLQGAIHVTHKMINGRCNGWKILTMATATLFSLNNLSDMNLDCVKQNLTGKFWNIWCEICRTV